MPTIRIDDEVYRKLQEKGKAFVDTPNSVLRRILDLPDHVDALGSSATGEILELELGSIHSARKFALIQLPKAKRAFFPGYKIDFDLTTDANEIPIKSRVTSAPQGTPYGDANAGAYIQGNLKQWYEMHPELTTGDKLYFTCLEQGKKYRLSLQAPK